MKSRSTVAAIVAATAAAGFSGAAIAGAAGSGSGSSAGSSAATTSTTQQAPSGRPTGRGPRGDGGPGARADLAAVAKTLGVTEAQLKSAVEAARPDKGTAKADHRGEFAAAIAKALGVSTADVQAVLDANRPTGTGGTRPTPGTKPDQSALVTALAQKFSVSEAKAQAALDAAAKTRGADHTARETAMYAAIAKALGKDASTVKAAFEANRPARPTAPPSGATTPPAGAAAPTGTATTTAATA